MYKKWWLAIFLFCSSMTVGIIGFMILEDFKLQEAFYMTVITFSTVGFREVNPLSDNGKLFTSFYIIFNLGIFAYVISAFSSFLMEGEMRKIFHNFLIGREVKKMKDHIIICGFGRNGAKAAEVLHAEGKKFVIVETDQETINLHPVNEKYQFVMGDATQDDTLIDAGIETAATIISTLPKDSDNVFITLTARQLNPEIRIIARAVEPHSEVKLTRAGANNVVMPDLLGGAHMAQLITKPYVIEFLDMLNRVKEKDMLLEEVRYDSLKDDYKGKSLQQMDIRKNTGVSVISIRDDEGYKFNPDPQSILTENHVAIILGHHTRIAEFKKLFCR